VQESSLGLERNEHRRLPRPTVRFGLIGRITKAKGAEEVLRFIDESDIPCEVHVAGAGEHARDFKDRAERPSDGTKVRVVYYGSYSAGERPQFLRRFFAEVDWLCIPSLDESEGIPTVALEALQHGVSVLTNRTGGLKSFDMTELGPPSSDVVWRVDPQDFRAAMARIANGDVAAPNPERCIGYYKEYFSSDTIGSKWAKVLRL
jgi:glycosyltransferase involved in cell wall biosynthesis